MKHTVLSVIMPALNEEENIIDAIINTLYSFDNFKINGEIIVINDGSSDKTEITAKELQNKDSRVRIISHKVPQGIGFSFWDGFDNAKGETIVMIPGDNENDPNEIFRYHGLLENVDIVVPFLYNREIRPLFRNFLSLIYREIIDSTFNINLNYTNGTVLYRASILKDIDHRSSGFFFQTDILIRLIKRGYLFAEVPYFIGKRTSGSSKALSYPSLLQVIKGYFRLIRDIYSKKHNRQNGRFIKGSLTEQRYKANNR